MGITTNLKPNNMEKIMAILMADLSGFTAMTEVHGAEIAAQMIRKYVQIVEISLTGESMLLERAGDQVVVVSPNPDDLAQTAFELKKRIEKETNFLAIHAGMHYGEILELDGHFYGSAMNLSARIAAQAKQGKILCSQDFVDSLSDTGSYNFISYGRFHFKNVLESKLIVEMQTAAHFSATKLQCPVCHMQLDIYSIGAKLVIDDASYNFCSEDCKELFISYELHKSEIAV